MSDTTHDLTPSLLEYVSAAAADDTPLEIRGGGSKLFYGREPKGKALDMTGHRGIVRYEPTELVMTARSGTPLEEIEKALAERHQMLPFEPPHFSGGATIGGTIASGLAGPARPWSGGPRDALLGVRILDGRGRVMRFGGEVMKNVAGYDIARLMAGALGTLGVLLEVSLKVLPTPSGTQTLRLELSAKQGLNRMTELATRPVPLSGAAHLDGQLYLRLACSEALFEHWRQEIGGEVLEEDNAFWRGLRDHALPFFKQKAALWRVSLPPASQWPEHHETLIDWGGAQRWIITDEHPEHIWRMASERGGHATLFRGDDRTGNVFQPLPPPMAALQRRLKAVFDPKGILNPGRMYPAI